MKGENEPMKKTAQLFAGNLLESWPIIATVSDPETGDWNVQAAPANEHGWQGVKVSAVEPTPLKANYRCGWNGQRIAKSRDAGLLNENRKSLFDLVVEALRNQKATDSDE